jgi:endogenous inhibitor of DNA gyrase (YacG/DUF329 family)
MYGPLIGMLITAVALRILIHGLEPARTRKLALLGLVPAGCSFGAFAWTAFDPRPEVLARVAPALGAVSAGLAHAVTFSLVALPPRKVWLRMILVPSGLWAGTFAALWIVVPQHSLALKVTLFLLATATVTSWVLVPFYGKNRGFVQHGSRRFPSVRFPCPRCGTRVDWGQGLACCTDCGLFIHLLWPADELQKKGEGSDVSIRRRSRVVAFPCPACQVPVEWIQGDNACPNCKLKLSMHWSLLKKKGL